MTKIEICKYIDRQIERDTKEQKKREKLNSTNEKIMLQRGTFSCRCRSTVTIIRRKRRCAHMRELRHVVLLYRRTHLSATFEKRFPGMMARGELLREQFSLNPSSFVRNNVSILVTHARTCIRRRIYLKQK